MFFDANDINRYVTTFLFLSQATLSTLLAVAAVKNHFIKKRMRPAVAGLALFAGFGAAQTFFRLIARMIVKNGGSADLFVQEWPWTAVNALYTVSAITLLVVLMRAYPGQHNIDLEDRIRIHVPERKDLP